METTREKVFQAQQLKLAGWTIRQIMEKFNISRTTAQRWTRGVKSKNVLGKFKIPEKAKEMTKEKARILANVACDGSGYTYVVRYRRKSGSKKGMLDMGTQYYIEYYNTDSEAITQFRSCLKKVYGIEGFYHPKYLRVRVRNRAIYEDIARYHVVGDNWTIPGEIMNGTKEIVVSFLRGFFDDEGHIDLTKKEVCLSNTNLHALKRTQSLLQQRFFIEARINGPYGPHRGIYRLRIGKKDSVRNFASEVGFTLTRKNKLLNSIAYISPHVV